MKIHDNGIIETYIGDTILYPLYLNIGSEWHPERLKLADGDSITFDVFEANKSVSVLSKTISEDDAEFEAMKAQYSEQLTKRKEARSKINELQKQLEEINR